MNVVQCADSRLRSAENAETALLLLRFNVEALGLTNLEIKQVDLGNGTLPEFADFRTCKPGSAQKVSQRASVEALGRARPGVHPIRECVSQRDSIEKSMRCKRIRILSVSLQNQLQVRYNHSENSSRSEDPKTFFSNA